MFGEGDGPRVPADRAHARRLGDRGDGAGDALALDFLAHAGVALPSPAMRGDFMPARDRVPRELRRALDRAAAGADRRLDAVASKHVHHAPPSGARAIFEMAVEAEVGQPVEAMLDLVDRLVAIVAIADRDIPRPPRN